MTQLPSLSLACETEADCLPHTAVVESFLCVATTKAPVYEPSDDARPGIDITAVLDRSGSMSGGKMIMLHQTVELMITHLKACDRLCLVSYDNSVETNLPLTLMDAKGKDSARRALKTIQARGSTNLSGGLLRGLQVLDDALPTERNEVASVLLMTDGLANNGITDSTQLIQVTRDRVTSMTRPVSLYTFGYGSDHDSELLSGMATAGDGTYYFMETKDSIPQAFAECLGGLMSVVAQNITLDITCETPGVVINSVTTPFPTKTVTQGSHYEIQVGDLFSEEQRDLLVDIHVPSITRCDPSYPLITLSMSCFNIVVGKQTKTSSTASIARIGDDDKREVVRSDKVDEERNRVRTAQAMEQAVRMGDEGRVEDARIVLLAAQADIERSRSHAAGSVQAQALSSDLQGVVRDLHSQSAYLNVGSKKLRSKARKHWVQRETECDESAVTMYSNMSKLTMKSKFSFM